MIRSYHPIPSYPSELQHKARQACSPLIQLFFGFASDIDQTNINRDIRDGNWLSILVLPGQSFKFWAGILFNGSSPFKHHQGHNGPMGRGGRWTSLDASFARCFAIF